MQYFDVLTSHQWEGCGNFAWYFVSTVRANSESLARAKAKRKMRKFFKKSNRVMLTCVVHGVGPSGSYSGFSGKYVGQFVDTALCQK